MLCGSDEVGLLQIACGCPELYADSYISDLINLTKCLHSLRNASNELTQATSYKR